MQDLYRRLCTNTVLCYLGGNAKSSQALNKMGTQNEVKSLWKSGDVGLYILRCYSIKLKCNETGDQLFKEDIFY